jgi:hypothetical protein
VGRRRGADAKALTRGGCHAEDPAPQNGSGPDADVGNIVEFKLPFPDKPGFEDVRLRQLDVVSMTPAEWEAFKRQRLGGVSVRGEEVARRPPAHAAPGP